MGQGATVALIDGEHHPSVVRDALDRLERERGLTAVLFCGGEEKAGRAVLDRAADHYGRPVELGDPAEGLRSLAAQFGAGTVVDLADEPVLGPERKLQLAALALHLGLSYEAPGMRLDPPPYAEIPFDGPKLGVIATGKRTGKTAVAGHWARLAARAMTGRTKIADGLRLGFRPEPGIEEELRALVAVETQCCPWATWTVQASATQLVLDVRAAGDGVTVLHGMFTGLQQAPVPR